MTDYAFVNLDDNTLNTSYPVGPLPYQIEAWDGSPQLLEDLDNTNPGLGFTGLGAFPVSYIVPELDATKQILDTTYTYTMNNDKTVTATQNIRDLTPLEIQNNLQNAINIKLQAVGDQINTIIVQGAIFQSKTMQIDLASRTTIDGAALLATLAISEMTTNKINPVGNLRWADPDKDFGWIAEDNTSLSMDAPTTVLFGKSVALYYSRIVGTARAIKNAILAMNDIKTVQAFDVTQNWPSQTIG